MKITKTKSYKAAFTGIAAAVAITLSFLEGLIPTAAFMPPGAKAGFSNIAVMFAASEFGLIPALSVTLLKSLFVFLTRGATAFFMSLAGGVLSTLVMYLLFRFSKNAGYIEIGILSVGLQKNIHRHTGGLENSLYLVLIKYRIHRHTGGLENHTRHQTLAHGIHRHTGGLEIE